MYDKPKGTRQEMADVYFIYYLSKNEDTSGYSGHPQRFQTSEATYRNSSSRILKASAHILSRDLVSRSASESWCIKYTVTSARTRCHFYPYLWPFPVFVLVCTARESDRRRHTRSNLTNIKLPPSISFSGDVTKQIRLSLAAKMALFLINLEMPCYRRYAGQDLASTETLRWFTTD